LNERLKKVVNKSNPLDIIGDAMPERYEIGIEAMLSQKNIKGLIVISTPQIMTDHDKNAKIIVRLNKKYPTKPIICCFAGGKSVSSAVDYLKKNNIPNYFEPMRAVNSIKNLIKYE
jgi:acetyltransferase